MMRRQLLDGFGAALPDFDYHVEIGFPNLEQELACYNYVKKMRNQFDRYTEP
jgi:hypothetical protein